jgi:hypothetical protein
VATLNTAEMARQRAAPDEILPMSQASGQSDEQKFSSGVSQSRRGDELIEIVQYLEGMYGLPLPIEFNAGSVVKV